MDPDKKCEWKLNTKSNFESQRGAMKCRNSSLAYLDMSTAGSFIGYGDNSWHDPQGTLKLHDLGENADNHR